MADKKIKELILDSFRLSGFILKSCALRRLVEILSGIVNERDRKEWLNRVLEFIQTLTLDSASIELKTIEDALNECSGLKYKKETTLTVVNAFDIPRHKFESDRQTLDRAEGSGCKPSVFCGAAEKAALYRERYYAIYQRLIKHNVFRAHNPDGCKTKARFELSNIEVLLASGNLESAVVFGMITNMEEDKSYLEDPTGIVQIDVTDAKFQAGFYTENSLCLVEGRYVDNVLHVSAIGYPPAETLKETVSEFLGSCGRQSESVFNFQHKVSAKLLELEKQAQDALIVILSDVWLDSPAVLEKLQLIINGYDSSPPVAMIFAGNFLLKEHGTDRHKSLRDGFKNLADVIRSSEAVCSNTHFVFIPSPNDPLLTSVLPKPPIHAHVTQPLTEKVPNCHFTTNPCRIRYCTQDIVVIREDTLDKMYRNCIHAPSASDKSASHHFAKTIISQAHLLPLPLHVSPIHWAYDYVFRLYPLPDLVVYCDSCNSYVEQVSETFVVNPGSFGKTFQFKAYAPTFREIDNCEV